jgi:heterodisulfide reductase subunit A
MRPAVGREEIARMLKVPLNEDGFFLEAHVKLRPVDFATEGIFLAGTCHAPKFLSETISQAQAAAGRVARILAHSTYKSTAEIAVVNPDLCSGCGVCAEVCSYSAIELKSETVDGNNRIRASINESLCKGCGCCVASCRSGAIDLKGFTNCQLEAMISAALHS